MAEDKELLKAGEQNPRSEKERKKEEKARRKSLAVLDSASIVLI